MKIGVLSDTHDNIPVTIALLKDMIRNNPDIIIHLGDIISPFTARAIRDVIGTTGLIAVKGNNDGDVEQLVNIFSGYGWSFHTSPTVIEVGGRRMLLFHGFDGIDFTEKTAEAYARSMSVDAVLFGHTHRPYVKRVNGVLVANPGEACGYLTNKSTYLILDTDEMSVELFQV